MKINNINCIKSNVTIELSASELVDICNSLYRDKERSNDRLYADMIMCRDLSQYGHIDAFCFEKMMEQRGYCNE